MCGVRDVLVWCLFRGEVGIRAISVTGVYFFKQKTAYEIRNCDWSSDVGSADLAASGAEDGLAVN